MTPSRIHTAVAERGIALGSTAQLNAPEICELQSAAGLDFVFIDMEHGSLGIDAVASMIRGVQAGGTAAPIVRIPDSSPSLIARVLDAGAHGIVVPHIETKQQMQEIVAAAHFAPRGTRGACPTIRANAHGVHGWPEYAEWAADNILLCGTIESELGLKNYEEILSVAGLNAIAIGTFDLSLAMGLGGNYKHPDVNAKFLALAQSARRKNIDVLAAILDVSQIASELHRLRQAGVRLVLYPGDRFLLSATYRNAVAAATETLAAAKPANN